MKKLSIALLSLALLSACSQDKEPAIEKSPVDSNPLETESISPEQQSDVEEQNIENELAGFPEYEALSNTIDMTSFTGSIETDNPGNRILLFENADGVKVYKSILVKSENLLKIIKLDSDGIIYKDYIK